MKKIARLNHCALAVAALLMNVGHAHAQGQAAPTSPSGVSQSTLDNVPSTAVPPVSPGVTTENYRSNLRSLPNEPTSAGYSSSQNSAYETNRESWLPWTTSGYIGLSGGNAEIDGPCVVGQICEDPDWAFHLFIGGKFNPYFGIQLGYIQLSDAERNGGQTEVKGLNLVLTGTIPLGTSFSVNGRAGGTYGWTKTSVGTGVLSASGDKDGFGPSYGVGLSWDFNRNWSLSLDWDRHQLKYVGGAKNDTDITSLGVKYRF